MADPCCVMNFDDFRYFMRFAKRDLSGGDAFNEMILDAKTNQFAIMQDGNMMGTYFRYWWLESSTNTWLEYHDDWILNSWEKTLNNIEHGKEYTIKNCKFKAVSLDSSKMHFRFERVHK